MELSPRVYHWFVRPRWFTKSFFYRIIRENFDFNNKTVLDFGCGIGSTCPMFTPANYMGVDVDADRISYARCLYSDYNFHVLQESHLPFLDNSVDCILIISVLHHIPPEQLPGYLQEFHRVLRPKGKVIVIEPCFFKNSYLCNRFMGFFDKGKYIRNEHEYLSIFHKHDYQTEVFKRFNQLLFYNKLFFTATPNNYLK